MKSIFGVSLLLATLVSQAAAEEIEAAHLVIDATQEEADLIEEGVIIAEDLLDSKHYSEIKIVPEPLAVTNEEAEKPPGKWTDEQKLTLETFKEIVATDIENVWVVAYIDPRCRDCLILSVEWEKLTQIEEKEKRKVKLGYVDISVEENWKIIQDHTKGKKMTHTPAVTLYGEDKSSPYWYDEHKQADAVGVHTWVSSYADAYGYGYWDPEDYAGAGVYGGYGGYSPYGGYGKYGIGHRQAYGYNSERHDGALKEAGIQIGPNGKGYMTNGKWQEGKQINQI